MKRYLWPILTLVAVALIVWAVLAEAAEDQADAATLKTARKTIERLSEQNAQLRKEVESLRPWSITVSDADYERITEFLRDQLAQRKEQ